MVLVPSEAALLDVTTRWWYCCQGLQHSAALVPAHAAAVVAARAAATVGRGLDVSTVQQVPPFRLAGAEVAWLAAQVY